MWLTVYYMNLLKYTYIFIKFLFVILAQELQVGREQALSKMHFANCVALAAVLFATFIENLRHYSSDDRAGFTIAEDSRFGNPIYAK